MNPFEAPETDVPVDVMQTRWPIVAIQAAGLLFLQVVLFYLVTIAMALAGAGTLVILVGNGAATLVASVVWGRAFHRRFGHDPPALWFALKLAGVVGLFYLAVPLLGELTAVGGEPIVPLLSFFAWASLTGLGVAAGRSAGEPEGPRQPRGDLARATTINPLSDFLGGVEQATGGSTLPDPYETTDDEHQISIDD